MPLYDYKCPDCGAGKEVFLYLKDLYETIFCDCGAAMNRIISQGHGGTHGDEAAWIASTNVGLTNPRLDRPVTNRTEYKQRMKEKGVEPLE